MTTVVAQASGNYSAGATWTGGAVPGSSDTAQTGAYTVTIDTDVTAAVLEQTSTGHFEITTSHTITANIVHSGTYTTLGALRCTHNSGTVTVNGSITAGNASSEHGCGNNGTGTLVVNGVVTGGGSSAYGIRNASTGIVTVNDDVIGGTGTSCYGISNEAGGTVNVINGAVTAGSGSGAHGIYNASTGPVNITGDCTAGSTNGSGVYNNSTGTVTVTGSVFGSADGGSHGAYNNAGGTINISGDATGGSVTDSYGAYNNSTGTVTVDRAIGGTVEWRAFGLVGINSGGTTTFKRIGSAVNGMSAIAGFCKMVLDADYNVIVVKDSAGDDVSLSNDYPAVTDVRDGVLYDRGTLEGTLTELGCPDAANVLDTAGGTYHAPSAGEVIDTAVFGPSSGIAGTFAVPAEVDVRDGTGYGAGGTEFEGTLATSGGAVSISPLRAGLGGG